MTEISTRTAQTGVTTTSQASDGTITETTDGGSASETTGGSSIIGWRKFATAMGQSAMLIGAYLLGRWASLIPETGWEPVVDAVKILGVAFIAGNAISGFADLFRKKA
jgi:hypothetical protein